MRTPDEVSTMQRLYELGCGTRRIAAEIGCNRETVQRYLAAGAWAPCRIPTRPGQLAGQTAWLCERLRRHRGNADVVRQELASELGIVVSLRTVERSVSHLRRELAAEALATVRFETPPGRQLQIDFGQRRIAIEGEDLGRVLLFVATLGYSRRVYAAAFRHERQSAWLEGIEGAFRNFGGLPGELLLDNARALLKHHDAAGRCFASWGALEAHLAWWMREVRHGYSVLFTPATALVTTLATGHTEGRLEQRLTQLAKPKLLIMDEFGYLPFEPAAAHLLFQLVSRRYERGSILITSNRAMSDWGTVLGDQVVATAILDRLLHHSQVVSQVVV